MRVLHIFDHSIPLHSGYTFRSLAILREQRRLGIQTWHLTSSKHYGTEALVEEVDDYCFYRTPKGALAKLPVLGQYDVVAGLKKRLHQLCDEIKPQILHAHSPSLNALAAASVAKARGIRFVYEMRASWEDAAVSHGTCKEGSLRYRLSQQLEKKVLKEADHVVTICQGLADRVHDWGVPTQNITVIHNGVDLANFTPPTHKHPQLLAQHQLDGKTILGFLGSFYRYEGLHILLEALPRIIQSKPDIHLLLVGGGQQESALKQQVAELGIESHVSFIGRVPHQQVQDYYSLVDLFIYPRESILLTEIVTPLKPLEAMAMGGLVAASNIGGHREMIKNGHNGVLFSPGSPAALAESVVQILDQPGSAQEMRQNGRDYVAQSRCWRDAVAHILPVYQNLTESL
ncbi:glycosyltransferase, exosortase A system-associated [Motiliproteus coralliicola]|uniref:Glycosyltransferase, exosortase A system-associated n=1 Tax=Motiliproteus coralliicola TaxID=2283196 RepID=A0A369WRR9_9GAMM|nr:TIGR04063 family PEP-CTERM/XrtA system glycosyltransferase [Motiliproteus coralliicola]RDE24800.1 glycosyltransferase, exosortase A system-associated [Motiliproteus coralliicola]